ncbi:hypothetical protein BCR44DRAFT_1495983 [Catenaria anguillulae PL171]|uniref:Uncharacterized protein n=1 Tax=Catenaria anguillulae PL171 TaxID=765915 RepID=A0A1Y2HYZ3_9FUNG|nr:hypothetical protein BCR44DRAFT_1495983 [Catenaria anguillulae PL171]
MRQVMWQVYVGNSFGALLQLGHLPVYTSLGKALQAASRAEARVQLASHVYKLVPEPNMLIFAKAIRSGRKPAARVASFSLDSLVTFRVKVLTGQLPTLAQLHMYWPDRALSPLCTLCGSLDDQQHWVVCPRLADEWWELGVAAHECVEQLLPGADTTLAVQARSVLAHLLHPSRLRATAACVVDLALRRRFPGLASKLPRIAKTTEARPIASAKYARPKVNNDIK